MEEVLIPCSKLVVGDYVEISRGRFVRVLYCEDWKEGDSLSLVGYRLTMYKGCGQKKLPLKSQVTVLRPVHVCCDCCDCYKKEPVIKHTMPYNKWLEYKRGLGL